ncbi:TetR family transcriptional regulator [Kribbella amoyensis]|uniref:TetR family transcriptional regulator n=1 Tax=Kribbella amoyensis TaxID=996641 RepID=A0A561BK58_9ACTN|nr:TetR/AcrR family transcriptional regulator [Kribbella amoyensis]TWD79250.1 TetR family transcriptional regulator [Kribbella amoyensis]
MTEPTVDLPRVLQQLWGQDGPARPGPKPTFHLRDIGAAAVQLADESGLAAVSMSKVARALGFTTMSLYRYVDAKDDLYVVMMDEAFGAPVTTDPAAGWRDQITQWALAFRDAIERHPWVLQVPVSEPPLSPRQLEWMEQGLAAFADTALTPQDRMSAMLLVNIYVRGLTGLTSNLSANQGPDDDAAARAKRYNQRLAALATPDRFPGIAATIEAEADDQDWREDEFLFGLTAVLDGIQNLIDRRSP